MIELLLLVEIVGTGKTFLYGLLKDIRLTEEYNAIKLLITNQMTF